ncbi:MAG TPA: hypothetical protein DHW45_06835 [Candidatus Latescibacteria bacterium]|nr:hypothetical protein [Candidatus Latescibacterota bacterium]
METYSEDDIRNSLGELGLTKGATLLISGDLARLGSPIGFDGRDHLLTCFYRAFTDLVGPDGTLIVPTDNTDILSDGSLFCYEETPSRAGVFSEFVRCLPDSVRSVHPLVSYTAIGAEARYVCENVSKHGYGSETPTDRMLDLDTTAVSVGLEIEKTCSIVHHVETLMGVPYRYTKEFTMSVIVGGEPLDSEFYLNVRNLDCEIVKDGNRKLMESFAREGFTYQETRLGGGTIQSYRLSELCTAGLRLLKDNIYGFLEFPPEARPFRT